MMANVKIIEADTRTEEHFVVPLTEYTEGLTPTGIFFKDVISSPPHRTLL